MGNPTASSSKSLHFCSLLIASLALFSSLNDGDAAVDRATGSHEFHIIKVSSLLPNSVCDTTLQGHRSSSSSLRVVHKHGPCHKQHKTKQSSSPSASELLTHDESRVKSINSLIAFSAAGTPRRPQNRSCYNQDEPIFNPSQSTAYSNVACSAPQCTQLKSTTGYSGCSGGTTCVYGLQYGDQSYSVGYFAKDTLTISPTDVFTDFYFGCGQNNQGLFGQTAGLIGLARDQLSTVSQTSDKYGKVFSYCLPSRSSGTGYLTSGKPVSILDTCYDFSKYKSVTVPTIWIEFGGNKKIQIDYSGMFYVVSTSQVCLAFAPNSDASDVTIYGNVQQKTMQVVYDVAGGKLGFGDQGCA
ncbi:Nucleoid DNA-binding family protein [Heracleum sosnowskyi]|uniref:Nucleoid DNA-binding family protein n=1 Tax=Heracleum sosnowskyi TaxID=360622 RepID=A0AAD8MCF4_9APIA|nr:Nucleoid DNA-binding family protein [Heracleum sosnowskyi]